MKGNAGVSQAGMIWVWVWVTGVMWIASIVVHTSTYLGVDPIEWVPWVMWMTVSIFPVGIAAAYYVRKLGGSGTNPLDAVAARAPRWLRWAVGCLFAYAIIDGARFAFLTEGGGPYEEGGKYVLLSHGKLIRELTEQEFHQQRAYVVRGFSGTWMFLSGAVLMILVGAQRTTKAEGAS